jgi:pimeloyl-ACP methyl ester carboxylesterase
MNMTAESWVKYERSLYTRLVDEGFDVWMGNTRTALPYASNVSGPLDYSTDLMVEHDLPALLSQVIKETDYESVDYVGYSRGNIIMFAALARHESTTLEGYDHFEYSRAVNRFYALAPCDPSELGVEANVKNIKLKQTYMY